MRYLVTKLFKAPNVSSPIAPPTPEPQKPDPVPQTTVIREASSVVQETPTPQEQDPAVQKSRQKERRRRLLAKAGNNTLVTGGQGVTAPAQTTAKTLFGQ